MVSGHGRYALLQAQVTDLGNTVVFGSLASGGTLHVLSADDAVDAAAVADMISSQSIDFVKAVPSHLAALSSMRGPESVLPGRSLVLGGEAADPAWVRELVSVAGARGAAVFNHYGPTETTVGVATVRLDAEALSAGRVPVGTPVANTRLFVLDAGLRPVPVGVAGELFVSGVQLARGYVGRSGLTAERFVACPFVPGERMYRTGDRARWSDQGLLEFVGRVDEQVKIRGFRVEPGEVQAVVAGHPLVSQAAVIVREDAPGDKRLVGYLVHEDPEDGDETALVGAVREYLSARLPEHMVPSALVVLDALPLTSNGKLDRKALPAPNVAAGASGGSRGPATAREELICTAFAEVLGLPSVGVDDDFFALGGHSLLAVSLVEWLRARGESISVRALFQAPTPAGLAAEPAPVAVAVPANVIPEGADALTPEMLPLVDLDAAEIARLCGAVEGGAANIADVYPLAPLQEGVLFHHLMADRSRGDVYVLPYVLEFDSGARLDAFLGALQQIVDRHDIYRTAVVWQGLREPVQVVLRSVTLPVEHVDLDPAAPDAASRLLELGLGASWIDLGRAPLLRVQVASAADGGRCLALLQVHHMIRDHKTLEVLLEELRAFMSGRGSTLPAPLPFRDFVARARLGTANGSHERYFASLLGDVTETTAPYGLLDTRLDGVGATSAVLPVADEAAARVIAVARRLRVSTAAVFHLAWARVLAALAGRDDVVFGTVLYGRMDSAAGGERVLGPFINTLPVRVPLADRSVGDALTALSGQLVALLAHEHAPLAAVQKAGSVPGGGPVFTSIFNYRHHRAAAARGGTGLDGVRVVLSRDRTNYPVDVAVNDLGEGFVLTVDAVAPADPQRICAMVGECLDRLVDALEQDPESPLAAVPVLGSDELRRVLTEWNDTASGTVPATIPQLFEARREAAPDAVALVSDSVELTYAELDARANRVARRLAAAGVGPESVVAVVLDRSADLIVALLGVLKAGGAYLPVDPKYPAERIEFMLDDARPACVVTSVARVDVLPSLVGVPTVVLDAPAVAAALASTSGDALSDAERRGPLLPAHPAYLIYTSGSTGRPKGVLVSHSGVASLSTAQAGQFEVGPDSRVLQFASASFDAAAWELIMALTTGAAIVVVGGR